MERSSFYTQLVEFLGSVLGQNYEIAYHDMSKNGEITAIAHGYISGRYVGYPLSDLAFSFVENRVYETANFKFNYRMISKSKRVLSCASMFIKNEEGELMGILCISVDVGKYQQLCEDLLTLSNITCLSTVLNLSSAPASAPKQKPLEPFTGSIDELMREALAKRLGEDVQSIEKLRAEDKLAIVDDLNQKGVFQVKGAVSTVANHLRCSEASVYRYISKINREPKQNDEDGNEPDIMLF